MSRRATLSAALLPALAVLGSGLAGARAGADERGAPEYHDPIAELRERVSEADRRIVDAFEAYDAQAIQEALDRLEARVGAGAAGAQERHLLALGYLELAIVERFYDRNDPERMPATLRGRDGVALCERGLAHVDALVAAEPGHADALRIRGELLSYQITGMASAMTRGPEAKAAIDRALELDPGNAWARFALGRMLFHNPAFAGGDKERALALFRELEPSLRSFRPDLYIARCYEAKGRGYVPQALYWAEKAAARAPGNPEVQALLTQLHASAEGE